MAKLAQDLLNEDTTEYTVDDDGTSIEVEVEGSNDIDTPEISGGALNALLGAGDDSDQLFDIEDLESTEETEEEAVEEEPTDEEDSEETEETESEDPEESEEGEVTAEDTIEVLTELGLDISLEDLEEAGGDSAKAVEIHTFKKAQAIVDRALSSLNPVEKDVVDKLIEGFSLEQLGLKQDVLPTTDYTETEIEESVDIQKEILETYYTKVKGLKPNRAKALAESVGEDGFDEALEAHRELLRINKERVEKPIQERKAAQKKAEEDRQKLIDKINSTAEEVLGKTAFNDLKLTKAISTKAKANIYKTWEKINSNLPQYLPVLAALEEMGVLEGKVDKIAASAVTSKTKAITKMIKAKTKPTSTGGKKPKEDNDDIVNFVTRAVKANKKRF